MRKITVNGKKAYAKTSGNLMILYSSILNYILGIPSPSLMYMYSLNIKSIKEWEQWKIKLKLH